MGLLIVAAILGFTVWAGWNVGQAIAAGRRPSAGLLIRIAFGYVLLFIVANVASAIVVVPAGHRAVVFNKFSGVRMTALNEGMNFILPFVEDKVVFDVRVQKADVKASAASKDLQDVTTDIVLNFRPKSEAVAGIYKDYGTEYEAKVVAPAVQESVKAVVATYTAEELITRREDVKAKVQERLASMIAPANLVLVETYMTNFAFSQGFSQAIESKQVAEQNALKAKRDLDRIKIEAEQKVAQARAETDSLKMQRDAITPELLKLREIEMQKVAIEKWDGALPNYMMGNTVPFINVERK